LSHDKQEVPGTEGDHPSIDDDYYGRDEDDYMTTNDYRRGEGL